MKRDKIKYTKIAAGILLLIFLFLGGYFILPDPLFRDSYSTVLLDREGNVLGMKVAKDGQFRFQEVDRLPIKYIAAVLTFEDKNFGLHRGVDWMALGRALVQNVSSGKIVSGGSTLSMQVIRLARGNPSRTIPEKLWEILLTLRLELSYSKWQILCMYASHAPFGGNIVGIEAASMKYFNRRPEQLSWSEAALLAVLPNAPALIFPGKNNTLLKKKRDALLKKLWKRKYLKQEDYLLALAEPLPEKITVKECIASHLLDRTGLEHPGEVVSSFIDRNLQRRVDEIVNRHIRTFSYNYIYNAAVLVAHIPTGEVRAYVGNTKVLPGSRGNQVDMIPAVRSSGSILKPALYALMLQNGFILPGTLVSDVPSRFGNYTPSNFNRDFQGVAPASKALARSLNIPFVRLLKDYTYGRFYDELKQLGIHSLDRPADNYGLSLILGGAETSLWDLCNMYGGMVSVLRHYHECDGLYFTGEYERLKVFDCSQEEKKRNAVLGSGSKRDRMGGGDVRQEEKTKREKGTSRQGATTYQPELKASAIWQTLQALQDVERPDLESGWKNFASTLNLSWKTGTSFGFRDAWAVGVNGEYVIGVWVGNADGEGRPGLVGVRAAAPILFEVASLVGRGQKFTASAEEMKWVRVCRRSGYRASELCTETDSILICEAGMRTRLCPYHRLVNLDSTGKWQVNSACEKVYRMQIRPWFVLSPVQEFYYCRTHTDYRKLPPFRADCRQLSEDMMEMIYPQKGIRVFIPRDFGGKRQQVLFEAAHRMSNARIYWHVDDRYLGVTEHIHQMAVFLKEGSHRLTLVDDEGNVLQQTFRVVGKETSVAREERDDLIQAEF